MSCKDSFQEKNFLVLMDLIFDLVLFDLKIDFNSEKKIQQQQKWKGTLQLVSLTPLLSSSSSSPFIHSLSATSSSLLMMYRFSTS